MIDVLGTETHFIHHLAPVYRALKRPGTFYAPPALHSVAGSRGVSAQWPPSETPRPLLVASYGDLKKARAYGRTHLALMEHGYGQSFSSDHPSYAGGRDRDDVGLFLVSNEHSAQRNRERYPNARVEIVGCPKLDDLPAREAGEGPVAAISFHFDAHMVAPEATGTLRHYRRALPEIAAAFSLIGHAHPRYLMVADRHYRRHGIETVADFADVCRRADVYVCDYSSTIYEFASTGRPVVVLNAPWYRREVDHGLRFWSAIPGIQVDDPDDLVGAIAEALADPPARQAEREAALDMVYAYRTGGAQRAAAAIEFWIKSSGS